MRRELVELCRVYQATLEACRTAERTGDADELERLHLELKRAQCAMEVCWLNTV